MKKFRINYSGIQAEGCQPLRNDLTHISDFKFGILDFLKPAFAKLQNIAIK